jgi:hypothetical protein
MTHISYPCVGQALLQAPHQQVSPPPRQAGPCWAEHLHQSRCIHDNFKFVHASSKLLHARRLPRLLITVDIARAFDSVTGPFLLEILRHMGFPAVWLNCTSTLLSMASTKVLLTSTTLGDYSRATPCFQCSSSLSWKCYTH